MPRKRLAAPLTLTLALAVTALMSAGNRASGLEGDAVLVGAGDIASCRSTGDSQASRRHRRHYRCPRRQRLRRRDKRRLRQLLR